jgi:hypothetical protein
LKYIPFLAKKKGGRRGDGSFVLYGANGTVVWSTFDEPRTPWSPGRTSCLARSSSPASPTPAGATGRYCLANQLEDGNLVMYPVQTLRNANFAYWSTGTTVASPLTLRLDATGVLYLTGNSNYIKNLTNPGAAPSAGDKVFVPGHNRCRRCLASLPPRRCQRD